MFDHLLESSHRDDSNKWLNIRFSEEIEQVGLIEVNFTQLIWSSDYCLMCCLMSVILATALAGDS